MQISIEYSYTTKSPGKSRQKFMNTNTLIQNETSDYSSSRFISTRHFQDLSSCRSVCKAQKKTFSSQFTAKPGVERAVICNFFFGREKKVESEATFGCFLAFPSKLSLLHNLQDDLERRMEGTRKPYRRSA